MADAGEAIIAKLDDVAAKCFIEKGFTYRKRRNPLDPGELLDSFVPGTIHTVTGINSASVRLFALSLLWRAAVSNLPAFELVTVRPKRLEDLRQRILDDDPGAADEFPVYFAFFCGQEELPKITPFRFERHAFYRFFLDGVVCYVSPTKRPQDVARFSRFFVGRERDTFQMGCLPSSSSALARQAKEQLLQLSEKHGDIFGGMRER
ncbi:MULTISPECIES: hypothetical protein [unclassified Mesorhizobium]|uniref:hypothetical protein n=1 Tax=unclassified Mesorhizobium TaxID=325217 RepID=UPI00333598B6